MSGRYSYSSSWARGNEPWFRVGRIEVTTTVALISLGILSMLVWAFEGRKHEFSNQIFLNPDKVQDGEIWRLVTWPLVNRPDIWTIFLFFILYILGNQLENLMGRRPFMFFLLALTVLPGIGLFLYSLNNSTGFYLGSMREVELGSLIAFAAQYPTARFWPGVPAWGIVSVIFGLDMLSAISNRSGAQAIMLLCIAATALIGFRSFGYASDLHWVPKVRLPAVITGTSPQRSRRASRKTQKRKHLRSVAEIRDESAEQEIDLILDQVAKSGMTSLSDNQRKKLDQYSKKLRKKKDT